MSHVVPGELKKVLLGMKLRNPAKQAEIGRGSLTISSFDINLHGNYTKNYFSYLRFFTFFKLVVNVLKFTERLYKIFSRYLVESYEKKLFHTSAHEVLGEACKMYCT